MSALWCVMALALAGERMEIPVSRGDDVNVVPAGEHGVVVYIQRKDDKKSYEIQGFDTSFQPTWSTSVPVEKNAIETSRDADDAHAWVVSQKRARVAVTRTDLTSGASESHPVDFVRPSFTKTIRSDGEGGAWVQGQSGKHATLTWVGPDGRSVPVDLGKKRVIQSLTRGDGGTVQAAVRNWRIKPGDPLTVLTLNEGAIAGTAEIYGPEDTYLLAGRSLALSGDDLVVGTWQPKGWIGGAQGLYAAGLDSDGKQTFYAQWRFDELENFLEWMPDKRKDKVEKVVAKRKDKGKAVTFRYTLLVQDPIETERGTLLIAEAYYPVYHTYTTTTTSTNAQGQTVTTTTTHTVFLGWRFTHALIAELDREGTMLWDSSIPLQSRLTQVRRPHVRATPADGGVDLVYVRAGRLHTARIEDGGLVDQLGEISIEDTGGDDTVKNLAGDAVWWFDDKFLLYGTDKVKDEDGKSLVYFFSRLAPEGPKAANEDIGGGEEPVDEGTPTDEE